MMALDLKKKLLASVKERDLIDKGDRVLVGLSGGPDSLALLHLLWDLKGELKISVCAAHLNHMVRGKAACSDEKFVRSFCKRLRVPLEVKKFDVPAFAKRERISIEDAGRRARYTFFEEAAKVFQASKIALGHTSDDNVETILMRLIAGSGLRGLTGIPPKRGKVSRPLIDCLREEVESYCKAKKLHPRIDRSNYDTRYLRNMIRHKVIPILKKINPQVKTAIKQAADLLSDDYVYMISISNKALHAATVSSASNGMSLDIDKLLMYPDPIRRHVLRLAVEGVKGDLENIAYSHILDIMRKLPDEKRWQLSLPSGVFVRASSGRLEISTTALAPPVKASFSRPFSVPGEVVVKEAGIRIKGKLIKDVSGMKLRLTSKNEALVDFGKCGSELIVRSRRDGDRFSPLGLSGTKKLKDFLIDEKVPNEKKDLIPIVSSKGRIVWVGGHRINEAFKITKGTRTVLRLVLVSA
jgi:tRNA(Ile)-lysidine synthase